VVVRYSESHLQAFTFIADDLDGVNVQACECDSLHRSITKLSFCCFRMIDDLYMTMKLSTVLSV